VPLFVNAFFIRNGYCHGAPNDPSPELKKECRAAYVLAAALTGVAQLVGLLCAPLFGYLSRRTRRVNYPVLVATSLGIAGYVVFPRLASPEFKDVDGRGGSPAVFFVAALLGISQIGAIVCSLGSLGKGVLAADLPALEEDEAEEEEEAAGETNGEADHETAPLVARRRQRRRVSRMRLKGSVAGVYSWCGGAAILLLTKLGGYLFDTWSTGAPFYLMAVFNAVLLVTSLGIDAARLYRSRSRR
jgi:MFS family permease